MIDDQTPEQCPHNPEAGVELLKVDVRLVIQVAQWIYSPTAGIITARDNLLSISPIYSSHNLTAKNKYQEQMRIEPSTYGANHAPI